MESKDRMNEVAKRLRERFDEDRRILSFAEWLDLFSESPALHGRSAAQYVLDMFDHFGVRNADTAAPGEGRLRLFDQEFREGEGRVHGQEAAQSAIHRLLSAAADEGRTDKLFLLHGPNGSGKSVIAEAIFRGLEHYSHCPEGAVYRFNWVFPRSSDTQGPLGFGRKDLAGASPESYAFLSGDDLSARLVCEVKDHPLFLVPRPERDDILDAVLEQRTEDRSRCLRWVRDGDLCQKCKRIYEGLLAGYQGDWEKLIRHIQVERFFVSHRFRSGAVTIHPMGSVDAQEQQITADLSVQNLPPVLQNLKIFEPFGDLIDANGGVVEYGDFLKRPMDFNKYLLNAVEKGTISLANTLVHLNLVMLGTSNEKHLDVFKQMPEFTSFKGRIELVPVPYLLEAGLEAALYEDMLLAVKRRMHVAPHAFETAALWAVLTRLLPPDESEFEGKLSQLLKGLSPMEKARLYDGGEAPDRFDREERRLLLGALKKIRGQYTDGPVYEGRFGASAREMRVTISNAAYRCAPACLTPEEILRGIRELIKDKTVYDFLKLNPERGYHEPEAFVEQVGEDYARTLLDEFQDAMDLIREEEYDRRFDRYFEHVVAFNRKEKVQNPQTGAYEPPSEDLMRAVEEVLHLPEGRETFRSDLVARIGAFAVDHPKEAVDFRALFPDLLRALKKEFFAKRRADVQRLLENLLRHGAEDGADLEGEDLALVETVLGNLSDRRGYCGTCARSAAAYLRSHYPAG